MRRFFTFALGALAMAAVALISMFITMRVAIHGREAVVPPLTGLFVTDAAAAADRVGLRLTIENRFYSGEVAAGRILAQDPAPGSRVRREWAVRVTESLGPQRVSVPDLTGESERAAMVSARRLGLEPGAVAHLAVPGDADVVIAQTPAPNSGGADSPRVSLLVSDPASVQQQAYVMPQLVGLTYAVASDRAAAAGLHLAIAQPAPQPAPAPTAAPPGSGGPAGSAAATATPQAPPAAQPPAPAPPPIVVHPGSIITAQTPPAGRRVQQGDAVHITVEDPSMQPLAATVTRAN
ncbi:MAG TPA: PASTA domain-containing protein [Acidobacteriaceae bacterium]|nr:PASTA domain-containing protein [Acidobacteriaceae bacterium]